MYAWDIVGYLGSGLVFASFCMRAMVPLRIVAICSNFAFLGYGFGLDLAPVWQLHMALLPMNLWRLCEAIRARPKPGGNASVSTPGC